MSLESTKKPVIAAGLLLFVFGSFLISLGIAQNANPCFSYGSVPISCVRQGLLGLADYLVTIGLFPGSLGILMVSIGLAFIFVGLKEGKSGYLPAAGIMTLFAVLLLFPIMQVSVAKVFVGAGSDWCPIEPSPCPSVSTFAPVGAFSILGFATGIPSSLSMLKGRYHRWVFVEVTFLTLSAMVALIVDAVAWVAFMLPVVPMCTVCVGLIDLSKQQSPLQEASLSPQAISTPASE